MGVNTQRMRHGVPHTALRSIFSRHASQPAIGLISCQTTPHWRIICRASNAPFATPLQHLLCAARCKRRAPSIQNNLSCKYSLSVEDWKVREDRSRLNNSHPPKPTHTQKRHVNWMISGTAAHVLQYNILE